MPQTGGGAFMTSGPEVSMDPCTGDPGNQQGHYLIALADATTYERTGND